MKKPILFILFFALSLVVFGQTDQALYDKKQQHESWEYKGDHGPDHWAEIDPGYSACGGESQSPIDIITTESSETSQLQLEFHYHPFMVDLVNNGHTLIEQIVEPRALTFQGVDYSLLQFHFHTPSEHHVNGREYDMEIHFVHRSLEGAYAVLAVLVKEGPQPNQFLAHFMNSLPTHVNEEIRSNEEAIPTEAFPSHPDWFYFYTGSLTTPPCTEGINWIVLEEPVEATHGQIAAIHEIIHDDNRPIQKINSRMVFHTSHK